MVRKVGLASLGGAREQEGRESRKAGGIGCSEILRILQNPHNDTEKFWEVCKE